MTEEMLRPKYPHLENLDRTPEILQERKVIVTEKIDGFNARFGKDLNGTFWVGSRNLIVDHTKEALQGFTAFALSVAHKVSPGVTYYGEWAGKGIQKRIDYGAPRFYLFDVRYGSVLQPMNVVRQHAARLGCALVPILYEGKMLTVDQLDKLRNAKSKLASSFREGVVLRADPLTYDAYGQAMIVKYKSPEFEERASKRNKGPQVQVVIPAEAQAFVEEYVTPMRLEHVLATLAERKLDGLDIRNTGPLIKTMVEDVLREGAPDFARLSPEQRKAVGGLIPTATKRLAEAGRNARLKNR